MYKHIRNHLGAVVLYLSIIVIFSTSLLSFQEKKTAEDEFVFDASAKAEVVKRIGKLMVDRYIFLETAEKMRDHLNEKLNKGEYKAIDEVVVFARILTNDLRSVSKDRHIRVVYDPKLVARLKAQNSLSREDREKAYKERIERERQRNFGFQRLELLNGNVGYLDLRSFSGVRHSAETGVAAMNFLSNANAVIIDLRSNGGGAPAMIQLISSYFLEDYTHLNSFENRGEDSLQQFWTFPYVPGNLMYETDLYVLTSRRTFSAAEEFTYNMKNLKRYRIAYENFCLWVPTGRAVNPITKTNWEGKGIEPHISVPRDQALDKAHSIALEKLVEKTKDEAKKHSLQWGLDGLKARIEPAKVGEETLKKYVGKYTRGEVVFENGQLFIDAESQKFKMIPLSETYFVLDGEPDVRVEFVLDSSEKNFVIIAHFSNGSQERVTKVKAKK
jgi:hypothetical protein